MQFDEFCSHFSTKYTVSSPVQLFDRTIEDVSLLSDGQIVEPGVLYFGHLSQFNDFVHNGASQAAGFVLCGEGERHSLECN